MKAPPGETVKLTYDARVGVEKGDYLRTATTGRTYEVVGVRRQLRGKNVGRWHLRCMVMADDFVPGVDDVVHMIAWYSRDRRR